MKLRKRFWKDGTVEISNHGTCVHHCHSMDEMDQIKRNSAVRLAIGNEIGKGYKPTEVKRVLLNNPEILGAAGGQSITIKDCHNAALVFNKENKEQATGKGDDEIEPQEETRDEDGPVLDAPRQTDNQAPAERPRTGEDPISPQTPSQKEGQNHQRSNQHTSTEQTRNVSNEREAGSKKPKAEK